MHALVRFMPRCRIRARVLSKSGSPALQGTRIWACLAISMLIPASFNWDGVILQQFLKNVEPMIGTFFVARNSWGNSGWPVPMVKVVQKPDIVRKNKRHKYECTNWYMYISYKWVHFRFSISKMGWFPKIDEFGSYSFGTLFWAQNRICVGKKSWKVRADVGSEPCAMLDLHRSAGALTSRGLRGIAISSSFTCFADVAQAAEALRTPEAARSCMLDTAARS